ncbi:MAG: GH32 C-terminal domain-containing protein [Muribaculaceae bacterium]|nr:GH32 C-terminal domain-containing protein [Muribaculaceae bacterium]
MRKSIFILTALAAAMTANASTEGISVEHTGPTNTFVRVDTDKAPYLMIPIEENQDDALVTIIADGVAVGNFYVRFSREEVDFKVPFDLTPYRGKKLILDFQKPRSVVLRKGEEPVGFEALELADSFSTDNVEKYRPAYHHTPLYGWMNDPNGMFYKDGLWHLYYQWNPYGSKWQNMTWGHSTSRDLVNWTPMPEAIRPNALGTVFSGSAAVDRTGSAGWGENAVVAMYTSAGHSQMQSIARSADNGYTFSIYEGNPVLVMETEARDPKISWNGETGEWNMVLAHALNHEILFFTSPDLKEWTRTDSIGNVGATGGVWECPDLFPLTINGKQKWVLLVNINPGGPFGGSATQYFIGDFDGKTFTPDADANGEIPTKWMDFGKDLYATVTWSDAPQDRRVALGWMSNWQYADQVPTMQYRSANSLPRDLSLFEAPDGQLYLASAPSPELNDIRGRKYAGSGRFAVSKKGKTFSLPKTGGGICEITADIDASKGSAVAFTLSNAEGEKVTISYDASAHTLKFDRMHGTFTDISHHFPAVTGAPTFETDGHLSLRIFVDRSSIEVFADGGKSVMTNLTFPENPYTTLSVSGDGKAAVSSLNVYEIKTK